jgi:hypothetical protein
MQVTVDIPDQFARQIVPDGKDAPRMLFEQSVASAYRQGRLTMEQVRQALGLSTRFEVDTFLQQHDVYDYTSDQFRSDTTLLNELLKEHAAR